MVFECKFGYKFEETATESYLNEILKSGSKTLSFDKNRVIDTVDLCNIYYEDFGANGYDEICDFDAMKEAHRIANKYGHTYATWTDTYRGFKTYLPGNIHLNNVKLVQVKFENEVESEVGVNLKELYLVPHAIATMTVDISSASYAKNNPYEGTKELYITNCADLKVFIPTSPQFKNLKVHYDNDGDGICDGSDDCECKGDNFVATAAPKKGR